MRSILFKLLTLVLVFVGAAQAQSPMFSYTEVTKFFQLEDAFGEPMRVKSVAADGTFPWRLIGQGGTALGVIENIKVEGVGAAQHYVLDAQFTDGNDLKVAVPVAHPR